MRDGTVVLIALPTSAVAEYLARSGSRGMSTGPVNRIAQLTALGLVMDHVVRLVDGPETVTAQTARELQDLLCWSLLQAFEDPWADTGRLGTRSSVLRRALSYIEEHADEVVTMPEVAEAARIWVRSLGLLFREELDTTPFVWLRDLRLDRARLDLLDGGGTVGEVAARHGMPSGGRFAAQYRTRFKESPAVTLRRGRAS